MLPEFTYLSARNKITLKGLEYNNKELNNQLYNYKKCFKLKVLTQLQWALQ